MRYAVHYYPSDRFLLLIFGCAVLGGSLHGAEHDQKQHGAAENAERGMRDTSAPARPDTSKPTTVHQVVGTAFHGHYSCAGHRSLLQEYSPELVACHWLG